MYHSPVLPYLPVSERVAPIIMGLASVVVVGDGVVAGAVVVGAVVVGDAVVVGWL